MRTEKHSDCRHKHILPEVYACYNISINYDIDTRIHSAIHIVNKIQFNR